MQSQNSAVSCFVTSFLGKIFVGLWHRAAVKGAARGATSASVVMILHIFSGQVGCLDSRFMSSGGGRRYADTQTIY